MFCLVAIVYWLVEEVSRCAVAGVMVIKWGKVVIVLGIGTAVIRHCLGLKNYMLSSDSFEKGLRLYGQRDPHVDGIFGSVQKDDAVELVSSSAKCGVPRCRCALWDNEREVGISKFLVVCTDCEV